MRARFFPAPLHPYSQKLMASVPRLRGNQEPEFITGQPPSLINPPTGCRFAARCPSRFEKCEQEPPTVIQGRAQGQVLVVCIEIFDIQEYDMSEGSQAAVM